MIELVQNSLQTFNKVCPYQADIWMSIQCVSLPPKIHNFLFLALNGSLRIGTYWNHIPGYEDRAFCSECNSVEDLNHILVQVN